MRYHIDTIPVWDSLKLDGECLLCALRRKTELGEAERYLGGSVMEPDTRIQVNDKGFCPHHHAMLYGMHNRLGHALMLESHTIETRERLDKMMVSMRKSAKAYTQTSALERMTRRGQAALDSYQQQVDKLEEMVDSCIMCDSINDNMNRYLHTFFHLYQTDTEFRNRFNGCKGLCLPHTVELLRMAPGELPAKELSAFVSALCDMEQTNMDRIQEDVSWLIKKFDYRYENEPWHNSKDAVERTVNKLRGWCVGQEPNPKD